MIDLRQAGLGLVLSSTLSCGPAHNDVSGRATTRATPEPLPSYLLVFDRPQPKGTWARVRGEFERYANVKARHLGWVVANKSDQFHAEYDAEQTWQDLSVEGHPRTLKFNMLDLRVLLGEPPSRHSLDKRRVSTLNRIEDSRMTQSAGQVFTLSLTEKGPQLDLLEGSLSSTDRALLRDPRWLSSELVKETAVSLLFGTAEPQLIGAAWAGDRELARRYLAAAGIDFALDQIEVTAKLERIESVGPIKCYFVSGKMRAQNGRLRETPPQVSPVATEITLDYSAAFPTRLEWPALLEENRFVAITTVQRKAETGPVYGTLDLELSHRREVTAIRYP